MNWIAIFKNNKCERTQNSDLHVHLFIFKELMITLDNVAKGTVSGLRLNVFLLQFAYFKNINMCIYVCVFKCTYIYVL